jgi:hypothetical protein
MDVTGLDREVASLLGSYYRRNFTDADTWDSVQSIRFEGFLHLPQGSLRFIAFKKKPDYTKVVILVGTKPVFVMAYDGQDAWQIDLSKSQEPVAMAPAEAINFIRDATTGGHLFYPRIPNKKIELKGSAVVADRRCFELLVTLPDGQPVTSFIAMSDFSEFQVRTTNAASGDTEIVRNLDFREHEGIRLPVRSELIINGAVAHTVEIVDVQFNRGVMPWMFARSSGAQMPGLPSPVAPAEEGAPPSNLFAPIENFSAPTENTFSPFAAPSVFGD